MMSPEDNLAFEEAFGLNSDTATVTRDGNTITIDPDDNEICAVDEQTGFEFDTDTQMAIDSCLALAQHLTVAINAETEETGVVSYLYRNEPFINLAYAPDSGSYEIRFAPLLSVTQDQQPFVNADDPDPIPQVLTGAIKFAVASDPETPDEAGSIALQISEAIQFTQAEDNSDVQVGVSTLWEVSIDAEGGSFGFDLGAISLSGNTADIDDPQPQNTNFLLPGLSGKATISNSSGDLIVSDLGLARGPLSITSNSTEVISVALDTFGFNVSEANGQIVTNGDINLNAMLNNAAGFNEELSTMLTAALNVIAPSGSAFEDQSPGVTKLVSGGPFQIVLQANDEVESNEDSLTVNAGSCFTEVDLADAPPLPATNIPIENTPC